MKRLSKAVKDSKIEKIAFKNVVKTKTNNGGDYHISAYEKSNRLNLKRIYNGILIFSSYGRTPRN